MEKRAKKFIFKGGAFVYGYGYLQIKIKDALSPKGRTQLDSFRYVKKFKSY